MSTLFRRWRARPRAPEAIPPPPLVQRKEAPFRWAGQLILRLFWAYVLGHVFAYMWVAVYYIVTQNHVVKPIWDDYIVPWPLLRHFIRDYTEALLATTVVWFALYNRWSRHNQRAKFTIPERVFDRIGLPSRAQREPTHRWQYIWSLPMTVLASAPGAGVAFVGLYLLDHYERVLRGALHSHEKLSAHASLTDKYFFLFKSDAPIKLAGVLGGLFFARVVFLKIAGDGQRMFAQQRALKWMHAQHFWTRFWAKPRWPLPTPYRAEYKMTLSDLLWFANRGYPTPQPNQWIRRIQLLTVPVVLVLAYYGWIIMTTIAHK